MLGMAQDPRLVKLREANPLNNIAVPQGAVGDLESRIGEFYVPIDPSGDFVHPLLAATSTRA